MSQLLTERAVAVMLTECEDKGPCGASCGRLCPMHPGRAGAHKQPNLTRRGKAKQLNHGISHTLVSTASDRNHGTPLESVAPGGGRLLGRVEPMGLFAV